MHFQTLNHLDRRIVVLWLSLISSTGAFWMPYHVLSNFKEGKLNIRGWIYRNKNPQEYWNYFYFILITFTSMGLFTIGMGVYYSVFVEYK